MLNDIMFEDAYFDEKGIWFAASTHNGLYYLDLEKKIIEYIGKFPNEDAFAIRLYNHVIRYENKLIFIPFNARALVEYDILKSEFIERKIPLFSTEKEDKLIHLTSFHDYKIVGDDIYLFPFWEDGVIVRYHILTSQFEFMKMWNEVVDKYKTFNSNGISFVHIELMGDKIIAPLFSENVIFIFNTQNDEYEVINIGEMKKEGFSGIEIIESKIFLFSSFYKKIYEYDYEKKQLQSYEYECACMESPYYFESVYLNKQLYFLEVMSATLFKMDLDNNDITIINKFQYSDNIKKKYNSLIVPYKNLKIDCEGNILIFPLGAESLIKIKHNEVFPIIQILESKINNREYLLKELFEKDDQIFQERNCCTLENFMKYLSVI